MAKGTQKKKSLFFFFTVSLGCQRTSSGSQKSYSVMRVPFLFLWKGKTTVQLSLDGQDRILSYTLRVPS